MADTYSTVMIDELTEVSTATDNDLFVISQNSSTKTITKDNLLSPLQDQIDELAEAIESGGSGLTDGAKQALLNCFAHVAWIDEHGQDYYDALEDALYPPANLVSISCVYTQSGTVYDTDSLDDLRADLVVTAHYDNSTTQTVTTYTLSGTLTVGTSAITVTYSGFTTTFNVTVSEQEEEDENLLYNWDFTQSLTDTVASKVAELTHSSVGDTNPTMTSSGIVFNGANQICNLGDFGSGYFVNKTIEVDVEEFDAQLGASQQHYRLIMMPPSTTKGNGPLIYKTNTGWSSYCAYWSDPYGEEVSGTSNEVLNYFNGKTVKIVFNEGYPTLYVDGVLIGTGQYAFTTTSAKNLLLGGITGSTSYCYNMTISGLRIYSNS